MASRPRISQETKEPQFSSTPPRRRGNAARRQLAITLASTFAGVVLVAGLFYLTVRRTVRPQALPPAPASASVSDLVFAPTTDELRVDELLINNDKPGEMLVLAGHVTNAGQRTLTGAVVQMVFHDREGTAIATLTQPIWGLANGHCQADDEFANQPIGPNEMRFFCVAVRQVPGAWNHELPEMQVVNVTPE